MTTSHYPFGSERQIRVLIADSQKIVRQGIKSLLDRQPGIEVVADTGDGESLLALARDLLPDVIVTEIHLPQLDGLDVTRRVRAEDLPCQVLFLTINAERESIVKAFDSGAQGYILKESDFHFLSEGIRAVSSLETYLGPKVSEILIRRSVLSPPQPQNSLKTVLTLREQEIIRLLAEGNNSKDIAFILGISNKTVDTFRRHCLRKLQLRNSADLIKFALRQGMVSL